MIHGTQKWNSHSAFSLPLGSGRGNVGCQFSASATGCDLGILSSHEEWAVLSVHTHWSFQHSKASHYFQTAAELHLSAHDLCPSKSDENSFQSNTCWCTNITTQSLCTDSLFANWSNNSLVSPVQIWSSQLASEEEFGRYRQGRYLFLSFFQHKTEDWIHRKFTWT